jgi:hypothetical protein
VQERTDHRACEQGATMADKSPKKSDSKKAGKSLKEKRDAKREKKDGKRSAI